MGYESCSVYFQDEYVVDYAYFSAGCKLYLSLVPVGVYGEADALALVYVASLRQELDEEGHPLHVCGCLRVHISDCPLPGAWVYPLPLFAVSAQFGVALCRSSVHSSSVLYGGKSM